MELIPSQVQPVILRAIANPVNGPEFAEDLYLRAAEIEIERGVRWDWEAFDRAIVERFGPVVLEQIKAARAGPAAAV